MKDKNKNNDLKFKFIIIIDMMKKFICFHIFFSVIGKKNLFNNNDEWEEATF
jgi:hypothetical protein